jgi:uncharacterized protein YegP (UPF0339 family)
MPRKKTAVIKQTVQNRLDEGMFRTRMFWFVLKAGNGKVVGTSEQYTQKHNAVKVVKDHHPAFKIVDTTLPEVNTSKRGKIKSDQNNVSQN